MKSYILTGTIDAFDGIISALNPPPSPMEDEEEPFINPHDIGPPRGYRSQTK